MHFLWSHSCQTHFQPSVKLWKIIKHRHQSNNFYLKSYRNSIQLCTLIYWLNAKSNTSSEKNFADRFRLPPQANGAMQNYSILRPGYCSVRILDTKCAVGILRTYCHSICAEKYWSTLNIMLQENAPSWQFEEWMDKRTSVRLIHMTILTSVYWI